MRGTQANDRKVKTGGLLWVRSPGVKVDGHREVMGVRCGKGVELVCGKLELGVRRKQTGKVK